MPRRKQVEALPLAGGTMIFTPEDARNAVIAVGDNPSGAKTIDLTHWLDQGIDDWVWACVGQLRLFVQDQGAAPSTICSYGLVGIPTFFKFLVSVDTPCRPATLDSREMARFVAWLGEQSQWKPGFQKICYHAIKAVLVGLQGRGIIPGDRTIFPRNPFPNSNAFAQGETPLSLAEYNRLATALGNDLVAIRQGSFDGSESEAITVYALALALRTGINATPMLELRRDSLQAHPFIPTMMRLESFKRRGNATHLKSMRFSKVQEQSTSITLEDANLFRQVLERTQTHVADAPANLQDRVWLFVAASGKEKRVTTLTSGGFLYNTKALVERHGLYADTGESLRLNLSRLRKTVESRLRLLSNGDLFNAPAMFRRTPEPVDTCISEYPEGGRENTIVRRPSLPVTSAIHGGEEEAGKRIIIPIGKIQNTPVGRCKDSFYGDKAPKDGTYCANFLDCLSCNSFTIRAWKADLHRLFSFYWFLHAESQRSQNHQWTERFMTTMRMIVNLTSSSFDPQMVADAKEAARLAPLKFWKNYQLPERSDDNGTA
ncbi:MAG: hypothetical protein P4L91_10195 [Burkholderiaceae bacterium]|nr:hypothetical protein [Burkholderiaceae bacterium]